MANREALRELQARLAERLQLVRTEARQVSWLAVECAGQGLLLPLQGAGEIFSMATLMPVAHTQPWFMGVANLRDFAAQLQVWPAYITQAERGEGFAEVARAVLAAKKG